MAIKMITNQTRIRMLESSRQAMHDYIIVKLTVRDYHAVQDAASDLREIAAKIEVLKELILEESESTKQSQ